MVAGSCTRTRRRQGAGVSPTRSASSWLVSRPCCRSSDLIGKDISVVSSFEERLAAMPEVVELRRMFGIPDYFIRVQVADLAAYEQWVTTRLLGDPRHRPRRLPAHNEDPQGSTLTDVRFPNRPLMPPIRAVMADVAAVRAEPEVLESVASDPTVSRLFAALAADTRTADDAVAAIRDD